MANDEPRRWRLVLSQRSEHAVGSGGDAVPGADLTKEGKIVDRYRHKGPCWHVVGIYDWWLVGSGKGHGSRRAARAEDATDQER